MENKTVKEKRRLADWTTKDLMVTSVLGVVFGLLLTPVFWLYIVAQSALGPLGISLVVGLFIIPALIVPYIVRLPGAAIVGCLIASVAQIPFTPHGWMVILMFIPNALPIEVVFYLYKYKNYSLFTMVLASIVVGLVTYPIGMAQGGFLNLAVSAQLGILVVRLFSFTILAGILSKVLADAIAKTGVLNGFAIAKAFQKEI